LETNKFSEPKSFKPLRVELKLHKDDLNIIRSLIFKPQKYPQNLNLESIQSMGWESMWREDDLEDEEEDAFINYLTENKINPLYTALVADIFNTIDSTVSVAEMKSPCAQGLEYLRGGFLSDDPTQVFYSDLAWMPSLYFTLPIKFLLLRNGDSGLDPRIVAGPSNLINVIKQLAPTPSVWKTGLPSVGDITP
jgi:hypothetical protein